MSTEKKNIASRVEKLEDFSLFKNLAIEVFNPLVRQCYYKKSKEHQKALAALIIKPSDSQVTILNKQIFFWNTLDKMSNEQDEKIYVGNPFKLPENTDEYYNVWGKIRLVPKNRFVNGKNSGYRYLTLNHLDMAKIGNLRDFTFKFGRECLIYKFADKKELKIKAFTKELGHKYINKLLELVEKKWYAGTSENHSTYIEIGKDVNNGDLHGQVATARALIVKNIEGASKMVILL